MTKYTEVLDLQRASANGKHPEPIIEVQHGLITRPRSLASWMFKEYVWF
jgi:hypothetical protein